MTASQQEQFRIFIADDDTIFRDSLRALLEREPNFQVVGESGDGYQVLEFLLEAKPHLLLLNLVLQRMTGYEVLRALPKMGNGFRTLIMSAEIDGLNVIEALKLGAQGVLLKDTSPELLFKSIRAVMAGEYWISNNSVPHLVKAIRRTIPAAQQACLSSREQQIVSAVLEGMTNSDVAQECNITERTVKNHLTNIFGKLKVSNRQELAYSLRPRDVSRTA
jgi:two-component system nitrate/nitrite response regulator NarL